MSRPERSARGVLITACCLIMFLYALYFGSISVLLPFLGTAFRVGPEITGQLFLAQFAGFIPGVLVCGYLSDRWGRKAVLLSGLALYAAGLLLFGCAPVFSLALLAAVLIGYGSGAMETVACALAADLYPERQAFILNAIQVAFGVGASLGPWLTQSLVAQGTSWRLIYFAMAAANTALFLMLAWQTIPRAPHADSVNFTVLRGILRQPAFLALCLAQGLYVGAEVGFAQWMPTYFRQSLPNGTAQEGIVVTVFWIAMTAGRIVVSPLSLRMPLLRLILLLTFGAVAGSALALVWQNPLVVMGFVALTGLCYSGIFGLILAEAAELYPKVAGSAFGGIMAAGGVGGAVVPWGIGVLAATTMGWRGALALNPLITLAVAATVFLAPRLQHTKVKSGE